MTWDVGGAIVAAMPQPPALTAEQRQAALQKAAKVRRERAEVKEKLKLGSLTLAELLKKAEKRRDGREDEGRLGARVAARPGQGQGPSAHGDGGHQREPTPAGLGRKQRADLLHAQTARWMPTASSCSSAPAGPARARWPVSWWPGIPGCGSADRGRRVRAAAGEADDAYVFVDRAAFEAEVERGRVPRVGRVPGPPLRHAAARTRLPAPTCCSRSMCRAPARWSTAHPDAVVILLVPPSTRSRRPAWPPGATTRPRGAAPRARPRGGPRTDACWRATWWSTTTWTGRDRGGRYSGPIPRRPPSAARRGTSTTKGRVMAQGRNTLMDPPIEDLLDKVDSKFTLVALGSHPGPAGQRLLQQPGRGPRAGSSRPR